MTAFLHNANDKLPLVCCKQEQRRSSRSWDTILVSVLLTVLVATSLAGCVLIYNTCQKVQKLQRDVEVLESQLMLLEQDEDDQILPFDYADENSQDDDDDYDTYDDMLDAAPLTKDFKDRARLKREILAETIDGVPVNSESYEEVRKLNKTDRKADSEYHSPDHQNKHQPPALRYYQKMPTKQTTTSAPMLSFRKSRVMHLEDKSRAFKQVIRRPKVRALDTRNYQEQLGSPEVTIVRDHKRGRQRHRQRLIESMDEQSTNTPVKFNRNRLTAIHFSGDTSKYVLGQHTNFNGNGHMKHLDKTYVDWMANDWVQHLNMDQHFKMDSGLLTIQEPGLYLVYAQIYYLDDHDTNGFRVHKGTDTLLQCTTMTHSSARITKGNTCYTAGVEYLQDGDVISVVDISDGRYSLFEKGKSFFGVVKLSDVRMK